MDVYDALVSERLYKKAWPREQALAELGAQAGRQFDPWTMGKLAQLLENT